LILYEFCVIFGDFGVNFWCKLIDLREVRMYNLKSKIAAMLSF